MIKLTALTATIMSGFITNSFSMHKTVSRDDDRSIISGRSTTKFSSGTTSPGKTGVVTQTNATMVLRENTTVFHPTLKEFSGLPMIITTLKKAKNQTHKVLLTQNDLGILTNLLENISQNNQELQQYEYYQQQFELLEPKVRSYELEIVNLKRQQLMNQNQHTDLQQNDLMNGLLSDIQSLNAKISELEGNNSRLKQECKIFKTKSEALEKENNEYKRYVEEAAVRLGHTDIASSVRLNEALENGSVQTRRSNFGTIKTGKSKAAKDGEAHLSTLQFMSGDVFGANSLSLINDLKIENAKIIQKKHQSERIGIYITMGQGSNDNGSPEYSIPKLHMGGVSLEVRDLSQTAEIVGTFKDPRLVYPFAGKRASQAVEGFHNKALEVLCAGELTHPSRDVFIKLLRSALRAESAFTADKVLTVEVDKDGLGIQGARLYIKSEEKESLLIVSFFKDINTYYPDKNYHFVAIEMPS